MDIKKSPLYNDIERIAQYDIRNKAAKYDLLIQTVDEDIEVVSIEEIIIDRNYKDHITDFVYIEFNIGLGTYISKLHRNLDNLQAILTITDNKGTRKNTYKMVLTPDGVMNIDGTPFDLVTDSNIDIYQIVTVKAQLLDLYSEALRVKLLHGVFRDTTVENLLVSVLDKETKNIRVNGKYGVDTIDIYPTDNKRKYPNIILPEASNQVRVVNLANWLQDTYGVYNADIGSYVQYYKDKNTYFIYPLFNTKRFNESGNKVILYGIPTMQLSVLENTYIDEDGIVRILVNDTPKIVNDGESRMMNNGSGIRHMETRSIMKKPVVMTKDGPKASRSRMNYEALTRERRDGINYAPKGSYNNPLAGYSRVNMRNGDLMSFNWQGSDMNLIYPGMPCQYTYYKENKLIKRNGIVLGITTISNNRGQFPVSTLNVFLEKTPVI